MTLRCFERIHGKTTKAALKPNKGMTVDTFSYGIETWLKPLNTKVNLNYISDPVRTA
jgi:hypothetical protein